MIDREALDWATRIDGGLSASDLEALRAWLAKDPKHEWRLAHFRQFYAQLHGSVPLLVDEGRVARASSPRAPRGTAVRIWAASLAAIAALSVTGFWFLSRPKSFSSPAAIRESITLADGSRLDLNANTSVQVQLHGRDRLVRLSSGEAFFDVARDPARPFLVATPSGTVLVTGTSFDVRAQRDGQLEVTVIDGSVIVTNPPGSPESQAREFRLAAGDQFILGRTRHLTPDSASDAIAWREGKIVLDETPLAAAAERFAAYNGREILVGPGVGGLPLGGRYTLANLDDFLSALEKAYGLRVTRDPSGAIRIEK